MAGSLDHVLHVVTSGHQALDFLRGRNGHPGSPRPAFIILDLNLPGHSGHMVLEEIKADPDLRRIPVCILTSSSDPTDIATAYSAHANAYVTKPLELDDFLDAVGDIEQFWLSTAALPPGGSP